MSWCSALSPSRGAETARMRSRTRSIGELLLKGLNRSSAREADKASIARTARVLRTTVLYFSAEVIPMLTKSSLLPLVVMDPEEAGWQSTRFSATSAAAVTCTIMSPDSRPGWPARNGQKLQRIVRRGSTSSVRYRRAMMLLASAGGNRVPVIAQLVQADEDTVRDVIHRFNEIGLAALDAQWAGGRPRQLSPDDEDFVVATATTRPAKLGQPFTRWSLRKLVAYLHRVHGRVIRRSEEHTSELQSL